MPSFLDRVRRLLSELRRRHVWRVAAVYAVTAFVVVQVADLTFERLTLPPWTVTLVIALAALGFPLAVVLAWAFEVTPEGVRRTAPRGRPPSEPGPEATPAVPPEAAPLRVRTVVLLAVGLAAASAGGWWLYAAGGGPDGRAAIDRLAVLPLANLMNDPDQAYFVQGMHDGLISELQRAGVPVIARTSVLRYGDGKTPAREIARELDVDALVEGTVYRAGDSVEIDARLVDPATEEYLWSASFGGRLEDVVNLHRDLARSVADAIHAALAPEDEARLAEEASRVVPQAYDAYLKGVYHTQSFTPEDFDTALEYFETALEADSTFAPAWAGIARVWQFRAQAPALTGVTTLEARKHILPALDRALALDSTLADAYLGLAWTRAWNEWRFQDALEAFRRALELNPGNAEARVFHGHLLTILGRWEEALEQGQEAVELDPLNPFIQGLYGVQLVAMRRYEEGIRVMEELFRKHPDAGFGRDILMEAYEQTGRYEEALEVTRENLVRQGDRELLAALERGYRDGGYREAHRRMAEVRANRARTGEGPAAPAAFEFARVGEEEKALHWLEKAVEARNQNMPYIGIAQPFEPLHDDPRFRALARRVGVPILTGPEDAGG